MVLNMGESSDIQENEIWLYILVMGLSLYIILDYKFKMWANHEVIEI